MLIVTIGRWILGFAGVPYFPRGNVIFSIVIASYFISLAYGAFLRAFSDLNFKQILATTLLIVVTAQLLILVSTAISYMGGMETYFNHPEALNATEAVPFGVAMQGRIFGLFANSVVVMIITSLGYAMGALFPKS